MDEKQIEKEIINAAIKIYKELGPGLLLSAYNACLIYELNQRKLSVKCDTPLPVHYAEMTINKGCIVDMIVENCIIIDNLAVKTISELHIARMQTLLKCSQFQVGYILNWNNLLKKNGMLRIVRS